jgi:D-tyrosyl-tRNA(Tyr) deacylase
MRPCYTWPKRQMHAQMKVHACLCLGLVCLIGLKTGDQTSDVEMIAKKVLNSRLFSGQESGTPSWKQSVVDVKGEVLCISQFTLYGRLKAAKPDFTRAMHPGEVRIACHTALDMVTVWCACLNGYSYVRYFSVRHPVIWPQ